MRKKVLACILLSILLINSLVTPIAYSLDNVVPNPDEVTQVEPKASDDSSEEENTTAEKLDVSLTPETQEASSDDSKVTEENAEAEEKKEVAEEQPQQKAITSQEVTIPKVSIYKEGDKETKDIAATFRLVQESNSSEIATWSSTEDSPQVELTVGTIYLIKVSKIASGYSAPSDVKIRMTEDGKFEMQNSDDWEIVDQFDISATSVSVRRAAPLRAGQTTQLTAPQTVGQNEIAPINRLRIVDDIPGAKVEFVSGTNIRDRFAITSGVQQPEGGSPLYGGGSLTNNYIGHYIDHNIEKTEKNAYTVQFNGSTTGGWDYTTNVNTGWNSRDLSLSTTTMTATFKYTNAAYYDGKLVDAVATVKVTPQKNRTGNNGDYLIYNRYQNVSYYPAIQVGATLYSGWSWQNVNEFNIEIKFYEKGSSTPIQFQSGTYNDIEATYYTINSLNPAGQYNNGQDSQHGPEYVLPDSTTVSAAYKYNRSNITTSYSGDTQIQYAYNGGTNAWGNDQDKQSSPDWSMNSVLFTAATTDRISITLGNLSRPSLVGQNGKRTNYMWATISTDSFTNTYVTYKDIHARKDWQGYNNPTNDITIELWSTWKQTSGQNVEQKRVLGQTQTLTAANGWQTNFKEVPDETSMLKLLQKANAGYTITDFKYEIVEKNLPDGYKVKYSGASDAQGGFVITNTQTHTGLTITKSWLVNGTTISNQDTSTFGKLKVTLKRRVGNQIDTSFNQVVELEYNSNASTSWKKTINNLPIQNDEDKNYTYYIEEDLSTLPTNFELHGYRNTNSGNYVTDGSQAGIPLKYDPAQNNLGVTNNKTKTSLTITKVWLENGQAISNQNTSNFGPIKVTLKRKFGQTGDGQFSQVVELKYDSDASLSWKATVDNLPIKDSYGRVMTYYIEEDVTTLPPNFYIKSYVNDKPLDPNPTNNQLSVTNERLTGNITIRKLWYMNDGETLLANGELPSRLKVKLYRTTNGQTTGGELFKEITLIRQGTEGNYRWTLTEPVPITDNNKNFYTYYIEEEQPVGYLEISAASEKTTTFTSSNYQTTPTLTVKNKVNPVYPSTGGFGSRPYMMIGIISLFVAVILYYMQKKKIFWRKEK